MSSCVTNWQYYVCCLLFSWQVIAYAANPASPPELQDLQHPLADKIWDVRGERFIGKSELLTRILDSEYLLLGETHDNSRHHAIQAEVIDLLHDAQRNASVSFEMINHEQDAALAGRTFESVAELIDVLQRIEDKWPYTRDYQVVFESVLRAGYEIRSANLDRKSIRRIAGEGTQFLPHAIQQQLETTVFTPQQQAMLRDDIISGHCDMLPATAVQPMMNVQRVRDAVMSQSLLQSEAPVKVLIAGSGHVRKDLGVPFYLYSAKHDARVLAVGMLEVRTELTDPQSYTERWGGSAIPFDYVWFTPRAERTDLCAGLRDKISAPPIDE